MSGPDSGVPQWEFRDHGRVGSTGLVRLAEATLRAFRERGIPLLPGNRLQTAADLIQASHELRRPVTRDDPVTAMLVGDAIRDVWDLYLIARTLPVKRDADLNGKLKLVLRDDPTSPGGTSSTSRDLQFELLVAAVFAMAGVPTRPAEPDLRIMVDEREWGVAVKRVRSEAKLATRTTHARKQIEAQNLQGLIVVNVDAFLEDLPASGAPGEVGRRFSDAITRLHRLLPDLARQHSLLGIAAMGRVVGWEFAEAKPRLFHPWILQARAFGAEGEADVDAVETLFRRLQRQGGERMDQLLRDLESASRP